ncbi:LLM class flavin-dependent oxidoreductase [Plantactinospora sp. KBS50]|uniref:LLM class flavin-dependent oxidoreductase n=1 Tax=Plantactinospora sp. KBS50 TaxID=2024580 RepID=UPI000BAB169E|nr:LLM class flavin-dependent oxidoreductase [Plantactinospora sp. KBS50]ASW56778.1 N5,N10-methylene tetrahydromethanopterin reductase [Plantactinospora sp. KBS50]
MDIALALPNAVRATPGRDLLAWAVEGERAGFSTLATLDRLVYDNHESLTTLAAAAAVTEQVRLLTAILIAPLHTNTALLAKQLATVDRLSGGRLTVGAAVGARPDDFRAAGADHAHRGRRFDEQLAELRRLWGGERRGFAGGVGPAPTTPGGPPLVLGGHSPAALRRVAAHGTGWISGSGGPGMFRQGAAAVTAGWRETGRPGRPRLLALLYFSLGDDAEALAGGYLNDYYGFAPGYARSVVAASAIGAAALRRSVAEFAAAGCDELVLAPCSSGLDQVKLLRDELPG